MNTSEYISSGILESYALGLCNAAEAAGVERMCAAYPEVRAELKAIQTSLNSYARANTSAPAPETKTRIFDEIASLEKKASSGSAAPGPRVIPMYRYMAAASVALLTFSIIGNIVFYGRWQQANNEVIALNQEKNVLADNLNTSKVNLDNMSQHLAVMGDPDVTRVMMKSVDTTKQNMAMIYWNKRSREVFIEVKVLPAPDPGTQYQLWAIVDGKPVDAGMLPIDTSGKQMTRMKDFPAAQAFAITLEKEGGSPSPSLDKLVVMGQTPG